MAFAFQFLLANFSVATAISSDENPLDTDDEASLGKKIRKIESKVGIWTLLTVNLAIFSACFLAVKLSLIDTVALGAIVAIVIWSAYFLLLLLLSSTAIGSVVGSVVNTATSGMEGVMATASAALGAKAVNAQVVNTVEASLAAVRRELSSAVDPTSVKETVQEYLTSLPVPKLDLKQIRNDFEKLLTSSDLRSLADSEILSNINRQTFVDLVSNRIDLSKQDVNRIAEQLEAAWQQVLGSQQQTDTQTKLLELIKQASREGLKPERLREQIGQLVGVGPGKSDGGNDNGLMEKSLEMGVTAIVGKLLADNNLSDLDLEKISSQLQQLKDRATEQAKAFPSKITDRISGQRLNVIKADVENYLLNAKPWHLNRETIKQEFKEVIHDLEAAPGLVRWQLEQLNRDDFVTVLKSRENLNSEQISEIADLLEEIRQDVLQTVQAAESQERSQDLRHRVENYLRSTGKEELNPEGIERDFKTLMEDPEAGIDALRTRLSQFDRDTLVKLLSQREDFSQEEASTVVDAMESTRERVLSEAQELQERTKSQADDWRQRVESYLRNTNQEELNPEGIKRDLQTLLQDPPAGIKALQERLSQFDRDTLVQLLSGREDLSEEQINQTIDRFLEVRDSILNAPQELAGNAKEQYDRLTDKIAEYLRNTDREELDPEGIKQDLAQLLADPKQGVLALRERLSMVDRETLVKLLSQREDWSEDQVNQMLELVEDAIASIVKAPRRLASRAQDTVRDFQADFEAYLRSTNKEELNPEGIKRDLNLMLKDPRVGLKNISERLSQFDRDTLVAILSQREDISPEEANQIVDNIESVRDRFVKQVREAQRRMQSAIDGIFAKIRNYLNSLDRPELNYDGIKRDFRKLFDDPEAGFEALGERLSQFDRDTLVALLSSREDISEAEANRIIDQIESVRDSVLNRAQRLQLEAQKRFQQLKHNAKEQIEEARKAAAIAAWWLFGTAISSLGVAAIAGILAVGKFS
jgi:ABC-type transporter Mla MlaB component/nucleoid DNA-binding protein/uncharacterized protein YlzI (FlbEa/FlbD family)